MGSRFNCELLSDGTEVTFKYGGMSTDHVLVADIKNNRTCRKRKIKILVEILQTLNQESITQN